MSQASIRRASLSSINSCLSCSVKSKDKLFKYKEDNKKIRKVRKKEGLVQIFLSQFN